MGNFLSVPILLIATILQSSLITQIKLLGGLPEIVLLVVITWSINAEFEEGLVWAFVGGIMQDLLSITPVGTSTFSMIIIIYFISGLGERVYRVGPILLIGIVLIGTIFQHLVTMFILSFTSFPVDWVTSLAFVTAPTVIYNFAFVWPIYWFVRRIQKRLN